jgi:hypothetical protein
LIRAMLSFGLALRAKFIGMQKLLPRLHSLLKLAHVESILLFTA